MSIRDAAYSRERGAHPTSPLRPWGSSLASHKGSQSTWWECYVKQRTPPVGQHWAPTFLAGPSGSLCAADNARARGAGPPGRLFCPRLADSRSSILRGAANTAGRPASHSRGPEVWIAPSLETSGMLTQGPLGEPFRGLSVRSSDRVSYRVVCRRLGGGH